MRFEEVFTEETKGSWVASAEYFAEVESLQHIGFTGVFDTDVFVQTSFVQGLVRGALVTTFSKDNEENQKFIVYRLPAPAVHTLDVFTVGLVEQSVWSLALIKRMVATFPWVSFIVFNVLLFLLPAVVGTVFRTIEILALIITFGVFAYKVVRYVQRWLQRTSFSLNTKTISFVQEEDERALNVYQLEALYPLSTWGVHTAVFYEEYLYIKQPLGYEVRTEAEVRSILVYMNEPDFVRLYGSL